MFAIVAGGGKVGANVARTLLRRGHEITLIEQRPDRYERLEHEFEHQVQLGDATEMFVLERAGIGRPAEIVIAVTGDDEDNILICQVAKEKYLVDRIIARVNNPRNREHFDLLGIKPVVSATDLILRLIEHEVPEYGLVHLLDLPEQRLEEAGASVDIISLKSGEIWGWKNGDWGEPIEVDRTMDDGDPTQGSIQGVVQSNSGSASSSSSSSSSSGGTATIYTESSLYTLCNSL